MHWPRVECLDELGQVVHEGVEGDRFVRTQLRVWPVAAAAERNRPVAGTERGHLLIPGAVITDTAVHEQHGLALPLFDVGEVNTIDRGCGHCRPPSGRREGRSRRPITGCTPEARTAPMRPPSGILPMSPGRAPWRTSSPRRGR